MGTAIFVKKLTEGWSGDAALYRLEPPLIEKKWHPDLGDYTKEFEYVIVSAVFAWFSGDETYLFPATELGQPIEMLELTGSFKGAQCHSTALANAGYDFTVLPS